ncbi:MAG: 16S rRNA (guanine(966)-N(2))-methyltransferase RsmD [Desulfamplus sp.]|nr:16S rRNA (guanine(966)-N(2))-methyltransferase RsmD [Desulfamplus sp.]
MRIISGTCRGRRLAALKGINIRPTSDKVRESIFNIIGQTLDGAEVLDLFAGTGAFGIECLSRGASGAVFVDIARDSCSVIRQNIELCGFTNQSVVFQYDAVKLNSAENITLTQSNIKSKQTDILSKQFDLIFADPPYEMGFVAKILKNKAILKSLGSDSLMILEHTLKEKIPDDIEMLDIYDQRQYGKTLISFFKQSS